MGNVMMSKIVPQTLSPAPGLLLSRMAPGSVVKLNENGTPVEFLVLEHDYESTKNGEGRTLLIRKDCYDKRNWADFNTNDYREASIAEWLTGTYAQLFEADVQAAMGSTYFKIAYGSTSSIFWRSDPVFLLSCTEIGFENQSGAIEGTAISAVKAMYPAMYNGTNTGFWLRSTYGTSTKYAYGTYANNGDANAIKCGTYRANTTDKTLWQGTRPCFTLPDTALFDEETLLFKGVL